MACAKFHSEVRHFIDHISDVKNKLDDPLTLQLLCEVAVDTEDFSLLESILQILSQFPVGACKCLASFAEFRENNRIRKHALIILSLLRCNDAKVPIIQGLRDPDPEIQSAAALNIGLCFEPDFLKAVERFFKNFD